MKLVESKYKSIETGVEVFAMTEILNQDLVNLANSGLVSGNIVSYSNNSFAFETDKLMLPKFIDSNFAEGLTIVSLPLKIDEITKELRQLISPRLQSALYDITKVDFIKNQLQLNSYIQKLEQLGRDDVISIIREFFNNNLLKRFPIDIHILADKEGDVHFKITTKPMINLEEIFDSYIEAIIYQNTIYKSKVGSEKLCFCPLETNLGEEISSIITLFNNVTKEVRNLISIELINVIEELKNTSFDNYGIEEIKNTGIEVNGNVVSYFKDICYPVGRTVLVTDTITGLLTMCSLKKEIKYLPNELNVEEYKHLFDSIIELDNIYSI